MKTLETIEAMFANEVGSFAVDTVGEIERVDCHRKAYHHAHRPKLFIRIRVESSNVGVDLNTKFGCSIAEAIEIVRRAAELGYETAGICFHVGTQSTNPDNYFLGVRSAILVAEEVKRRFGIFIPAINIGGGFCDRVAAARAGIDLHSYYESIGLAARQAIQSGYEIYAEPGRCLVSAAGVLVTSVLGTNFRNGRKWVYLDDGIYGCYSIKLYERPAFEFFPVNSLSGNFLGQGPKAEENLCSCTLAGPTCDSLDVVADDVKLPNTLDSGDVLFTPNLGAYSVSTSSAFNGFSRAECYLIKTLVSGKGKLTTAILKNGELGSSAKTANLSQR